MDTSREVGLSEGKFHQDIFAFGLKHKNLAGQSRIGVSVFC